ncbi:hypothetical protein H0H93_001286 [Arthromyces matolae]|nr:hypothetical protein H0H93_001286 [Arthromyces matolae]
MNPFNITHPTAVQASLFASAVFARFDPSGRYLGVGRSNGAAAVWDLETRSRIRSLEGHVKAVTCLDNIVLALLGSGEAYVEDLRRNSRSRVELCEVDEAPEAVDEEPLSRSRSPMTTARFDPSGKNIFIGTSSGYVLVFNTRTKKMIARHKISGAVGSIKSLAFAKSGRRLATNSSDRIIRQFNLPTYESSQDVDFIEDELEPTHRFNDPINRTGWHGMSYSPDGEWLAGGATDTASHKIYIWDISNDGQFATALDGGREPLVDIHWHPSKSSIVSTTREGNVLIWHSPNPERWGAFAGGFEEVDENVEYEEREDEFDIEDEEEIMKRKMKAEDEEVDIDTLVEETSQHKHLPDGMDAEDEDSMWATCDRDDAGEFKMKIFMQDDVDV